MEDVENILEFSGVREGNEGGVNDNTNRNNTWRRAGKHWTPLHSNRVFFLPIIKNKNHSDRSLLHWAPIGSGSHFFSPELDPPQLQFKYQV